MPPIPETPLGRLAALVASNDRLLLRLDALRWTIADAEDYLARPDANSVLGRAVLGRAVDQRRAVLTQLRANRIEARAYLGSAA